MELVNEYTFINIHLKIKINSNINRNYQIKLNGTLYQ